MENVFYRQVVVFVEYNQRFTTVFRAYSLQHKFIRVEIVKYMLNFLFHFF